MTWMGGWMSDIPKHAQKDIFKAVADVSRVGSFGSCSSCFGGKWLTWGLGVGGDHSNKVLYLKGLLKIYRFSGLTVNVLCHLTSIWI